MKILTAEHEASLRDSCAKVLEMKATLNASNIAVLQKAYASITEDSKEIQAAEDMLLQELRAMMAADETVDVNTQIAAIQDDFNSIIDEYLSDNIYCNIILNDLRNTFANMLTHVQERIPGSADVVINFVKMNENAQLPKYAHPHDAGSDIYAIETQIIPAHSFGNLVHTGLAMEMPSGWELQIRPRSGMSKKTALRISNTPATIDSDYRGEICILFDNLGNEDYEIKTGDRIAQFVLAKCYHFNSKFVSAFESETERGEGGFGSSGN